MTHRATQRVAGLHLMQHTDPYRAKWGDAPLDVAMVAPTVRRPLSAVYAQPLPAVTTRRPGRVRRAAWWIAERVPGAIVLLVTAAFVAWALREMAP